MLGEWHIDKHKDYLKKNPYKASLLLGSTKKSVVHLYSGGDQCDKSGLPRTIEVKYKCVEHTNPTSPSAIALYLLEPKVCEYSLTVESALLCPIIKNADEFGQFDVSSFWSKTEDAPPSKNGGSSKFKSSSPSHKKYTESRASKQENDGGSIVLDEDQEIDE